jgi:esterase/lipase
MVSAVVFFSNVFFRLIYGYDINKIDINVKIQRMENPALFVTCRGDGYIDYRMTEELYNNCNSKCKKLVLFDEGGHTESYAVNREKYIKMISDFLVESGFVH